MFWKEEDEREREEAENEEGFVKRKMREKEKMVGVLESGYY